jgi:hypothetical protein
MLGTDGLDFKEGIQKCILSSFLLFFAHVIASFVLDLVFLRLLYEAIHDINK